MNDAITAFIDNEPFDPQALRDALATPEGRDELLDLIALRGLVQPVEVVTAAAPIHRPSPLKWVVAAAAAVVLMLGGYGVGRSTADESRAQQSAQVTAPAPTAVAAFENWNDTVPSGGN